MTIHLDQISVEGHRYLFMSAAQQVTALLGQAREGGPGSAAYAQIAQVSMHA